MNMYTKGVCVCVCVCERERERERERKQQRLTVEKASAGQFYFLKATAIGTSARVYIF